MKKPPLRVWALLNFVAIVSTGAHAYVTTPVLVPAHPQPGQTVSVEVGYGFCDALLEHVVTRDGNAIHVEFSSFHASTGDACIYDPVMFAYPIGQYEAGTYTVQVERHYQAFFGGTVHDPMATLGLIVGAEPIAALSSIAAMVLMVGCVVLVWWYRPRPARSAHRVRGRDPAPPAFPTDAAGASSTVRVR